MLIDYFFINYPVCKKVTVALCSDRFSDTSLSIFSVIFLPLKDFITFLILCPETFLHFFRLTSPTCLSTLFLYLRCHLALWYPIYLCFCIFLFFFPMFSVLSCWNANIPLCFPESHRCVERCPPSFSRGRPVCYSGGCGSENAQAA